MFLRQLVSEHTVLTNIMLTGDTVSFVDRDMLMRFRGGGVGHIGTRHLDLRMKDDNNR